MTQFLGEFDCKLDVKGRMTMPSGLRKQISPDAKEKFVLNRGFENCLSLYPMDEWQKISAEINQLNMYVKKNREFARYFYRGASELELDAAGRLLLPKRMCEYAGIDKDVILSAWSNKIEIWSKEKFEALLKDEPDDFASLAEEVMGKVKREEMPVKYHEAVMREAAVDALAIIPGGTYVDVTFGGGGHSQSILDREKTLKLIAFDQDMDAHANAPDDNRFHLVHDNFRNLEFQLNNLNAIPADGMLADLGVSSHQFDEAARGFSIRFNADLDMRMDQRSGLTAKDILNFYSEPELLRVLREYGELNNARRVVQAVIRSRKIKSIETIDDLKAAVNEILPRGKEHSFLAQLFQALRIEVNDEMGALRELLQQSPKVLRSGGRLVMISYHSLEDRMVKNFINSGNVNGVQEKDLYGNVVGLKFKQLHRKPIEAPEEEVVKNPRARSAKMRIAEKL